jgi:hypothetical protein
MVGPEMSSQLPFHFTHAFHVMNAPGITFAWGSHSHALTVRGLFIDQPSLEVNSSFWTHKAQKLSQRQMQQQQKAKQIARTPSHFDRPGA